MEITITALAPHLPVVAVCCLSFNEVTVSPAVTDTGVFLQIPVAPDLCNIPGQLQDLIPAETIQI